MIIARIAAAAPQETPHTKLKHLALTVMAPLDDGENADTDVSGASLRILPQGRNRHHDLSHDIIPDSPPEHPVSCMQAAFEESIMESASLSPKVLRDKLSAVARRRQMLELDDFSPGYSSRWRQQPGAKFHPLLKEVAQITYGVHLLHNGLAISNQEVVRILQVHVDEIDGFVADTTADFNLATQDIRERIHNLLLPLEHSRMFNHMLCDKAFRTSILDGNDIIERIVQRTTTAMDHALDDVAEGLEAVSQLAKYLDRVGSDWASQDQNLLKAYYVMRGNAEGWAQCFHSLQTKGERLKDLMIRLGKLVDEVAMRAGIASRRKTPTGVVGRKHQLTNTPQSPVHSEAMSRHSTSQQSPIDKPLPPPPSRHSHTSSVNNTPTSPSSPATNARASQSQPKSPVSFDRGTKGSADQHNALIGVRSAAEPTNPTARRPSSRNTGTPTSPVSAPPSSYPKIEIPPRNPLRRTPSKGSDPKTCSAVDSAYSSCYDTPASSPHQRENFPRPSVSSISTAPSLTPNSPSLGNRLAPAEVINNNADPFSMAGRRSDSVDFITALPAIRDLRGVASDRKKQSKMKKPSIASMKTLFAKKGPRRDMGSVGE